MTTLCGLKLFLIQQHNFTRDYSRGPTHCDKKKNYENFLPHDETSFRLTLHDKTPCTEIVCFVRLFVCQFVTCSRISPGLYQHSVFYTVYQNVFISTLLFTTGRVFWLVTFLRNHVRDY